MADEKARAKNLRELSLIDYILDFNDSDNSINDAIVQMRHIFPSAKMTVLYREKDPTSTGNNQTLNVRGVRFIPFN
jgi:hypothetical protein